MAQSESDREVLDQIQATLDDAARELAIAKSVLAEEKQAREEAFRIERRSRWRWNGALTIAIVGVLAIGLFTASNGRRIEQQSLDGQQTLCEASNRIGQFAIRADAEAGEALIEAAGLPESDEEAAAQLEVIESYRQLLQSRLDDLFQAFMLDCDDLGEAP
jgi:hypothetical protein